MLWRKVGRADAGIDGQDKVDRNYVGECKEQETFPIASAEVSPLRG